MNRPTVVSCFRSKLKSAESRILFAIGSLFASFLAWLMFGLEEFLISSGIIALSLLVSLLAVFIYSVIRYPAEMRNYESQQHESTQDHDASQQLESVRIRLLELKQHIPPPFSLPLETGPSAVVGAVAISEVNNWQEIIKAFSRAHLSKRLVNQLRRKLKTNNPASEVSQWIDMTAVALKESDLI